MHKKDKIYVPPAEPLTSEYVPQVGDVVEVIRIRCGAPKSTVGGRFKIKHINSPKTFMVDSGWAYNTSEVRFISSDTEEPTFTGSYQERQAQWVKHHGIKVGSKVKLTRKAESQEDGWTTFWSPGFNRYVGEETEVRDINSKYGIGLRCKGAEVVPYFVLEPVK